MIRKGNRSYRVNMSLHLEPGGRDGDTMSQRWYGGCWNGSKDMQSRAGSSHSQESAGDIVFDCESCQIPLVVDAAAAGMRLKCERCGTPTSVPSPLAANERTNGALAGEKQAELQRHLKENESQRTEISGYINQLNIQLHRWQLRLQTLNERNEQLQDEIAGHPAKG